MTARPQSYAAWVAARRIAEAEVKLAALQAAERRRRRVSGVGPLSEAELQRLTQQRLPHR